MQKTQMPRNSQKHPKNVFYVTMTFLKKTLIFHLCIRFTVPVVTSCIGKKIIKISKYRIRGGLGCFEIDWEFVTDLDSTPTLQESI